MILMLKPDITIDEVEQLQTRLKRMQFISHPIRQDNAVGLAIVNGEDQRTDFHAFTAFPEVIEVLPFSQKFKLASRDCKKEDTTIQLKNCVIGGEALTVMAGPCAVESEMQMQESAACVAQAGGKILRGGAFKPRTSPYDFQGLGALGLRYLKDAADKYNLACISEILDQQDIPLLNEYVDIVQVGARNMHNFALLSALGKCTKPILLKRGLSATYHEWLLAAEYILQAGNMDVILCERGIRTFETFTRNTLDLNAVPVLKKLSHLPVVVDPSHGTGIRSLVKPMAYAAVAAGADGLIIEMHPTPDAALSDAKQTISPETLNEMVPVLQRIRQTILE